MIQVSSRTQAGFSFIEIIVSLMIIAIMAVGAFSAFRYIENARVARARTTLQNVNLAIASYNSDTGSWPTLLTDLIARPSVATVAKRWRGPYLDNQRQLEDSWNHELVYQLNPKNARYPYELYSWGKGGEGSPQDEWINVRDE